MMSQSLRFVLETPKRWASRLWSRESQVAVAQASRLWFWLDEICSEDTGGTPVPRVFGFAGM